jgi:large repetitive protein
MFKRALIVGLVVTAAALAASVAPALAQPVLSIESPGSGSTINETHPFVSGFSTDGEDPVTVQVFKGGSFYESAEAHPAAGGAWSVQLPDHLEDGEYSVEAEQTEALTSETGHSAGVAFTVDTQPPKVTLNAVEALSNDTAPSFTGTASETTDVTVHIFKGGTEYTTATASGTAGAWSSGGPAEALIEGSYSAFATQESAHGNGPGKSSEIHFTVITAAPHVTLNSVSASGEQTPSFSGTASDTNPVTILIYEGSRAGVGSPVASAGASGTGGGWTSGHAAPALAEGVHEYSAIAEQESSLGNGNGTSNEIHFVVDTRSPVVTLNGLPSPSNDATPTFSGTATDKTPVVVHIFDASEHEVASVSGGPSGGEWEAGPSKALPSGSYTAVATESSSLGNPAGHSENIGFTIETESPHVTLNAPAARSSDTTPSFSGTASETTTVTVDVYKGGSPSGPVLATATAAGTGGAWTSGTVSEALPTGLYTARAVQSSSLGNPDGVSESRTFEIDTRTPEVTLNAPPERSNDTTPSFSGSASDTVEPIVVSVFRGTSATGSAVATATAAATGGFWESGPVSKALEPGTYTARAAQKSSLKNPEGVSETRTFTIDTSAPTVKLEAPPALSNNATPTFKGTASDTPAVTVYIFPGAASTGTPVATATGPVSAGTFTTAAAAPALASGSYTAVALQGSSIGNPTGESNKVSFSVDTSPPTVTLEPVPARSNNRTPTFSGTTVNFEKEKAEPVTIRIFEAPTEHEVASTTATVTAGKWTSKPLTSALAEGAHEYTAVATEPSSIGNAEGTSAKIAFTVDTTAPRVTLEQVATPSNNTSPAFAGTASELGPVKVEITGGGKKYEATGTVTERVSGTVTERVWSATLATPLPKVKAEYVAVASQASSIGNPTGKSKPIQFLVDPSAPTVLMDPLSTPGPLGEIEVNDASPTFTGTAGSAPVTVVVCRITTPCAAEQGEWKAVSAAGGSWSATIATPLEDGQYQAIASERSATNALGATKAQDFTIDTVAPAVTIASPAQGAAVIGSTVSVHGAAGTAAHDADKVVVELFSGSSIAPGQTPVQGPVAVQVAGGAWSAEFGGLHPGPYTIRASQSDGAGNVGVASHSFVDAAPGAPATGPTASFTAFPSHPHVGETVTLVSTSTDSASPITGFAWNLLGSAFAPGTQKQTTSFSTPGNHTVALRVTDGAGLAGTVSQQIPVSFPLMRPFPAVRIVTTRSGGRLRLKVLTVEAPPGATVTVTCVGRGCPLRTTSRVIQKPKVKSAGLPAITFPRLQRTLPAGVALEIRITEPGRIGKFTRFAIRKGKLPLRSDACLNAKEPKPVPCSS